MFLRAVGMAVVVCVAPGAAWGQDGARVIAGPGVPLIVQGVEGAQSVAVKGAGELRIRSAAFTVRPDKEAAPDAAWYWLTGSPTALVWEAVAEGGQAGGSGATTLLWGSTGPEEWSKASGATVAVARGKSRGVPLVWLGELRLGREVIAKVAGAMAERVPAEEKSQAVEALHAALVLPGDRWRALAVVQVLRPTRPKSPTGGVKELSPEPVKALSRQVEGLHAGAIGRIARIDPGLAERFAAALLFMARLPTGEVGSVSGAWAPGWASIEGGGLAPDSLLATVLEPRADEKQIVMAVQSWLAGQPAQIVWVRDDAGLRDALRGAQISTLAVVLTGGGAEKALISAETATVRSGELTALRAGVGKWLTATGPAGLRDAALSDRLVAAAAGTAITIRLSEAGAERTVAATAMGVPVPAQPPGLAVGPFAADYTLAGWRRGQAVAAEAVTTGMLQRGSKGWRLYLECRGVAGDADLAKERLRVWMGPSGAPATMLEIAGPGESSKGKVTVKKGAVAEGEVIATRIAGGWCAHVPVPAVAIESGGVLRLGLERVDRAGRRSAWPRAMLPGGWQEEPGRIAIDVTAWDRGVEP